VITLLKSRALRRIAKLPIFLFRGYSWQVARWLTRQDAALATDFSNVSMVDLKAAWSAVGHWDDIAVRAGQLYSRSLGLPVGATATASLGYAVLRFLQKRGFTFTQNGDRLTMAGQGLNFQITNGEEIDMLREIFLEGCYDLRFSGRWVVLDVGANVGFASLNFAAQTWSERVIAFEPFAPTAADYAVNVTMNPQLGAKITLNPYAWSDHDSSLTVDYHRDRSGSMRLDGVGGYGGPPASSSSPMEITLRRASSVLDSLAPEFVGRQVLLKLDCEGSEYPILRDLAETNWLQHIDAVVLEWHYAPPDELIGYLQGAGFSLQVRPVTQAVNQGILLAWRQIQQP
jgi:FkbM family methyltransferase